MSEVPPNIRRPTRAEISELASLHYFEMSEKEVDLIARYVDETLEDYEELETLLFDPPAPQIRDRDPGYRPNEKEDPLNAFARKCSVPGSDEGPLSDVRVGLKDNISVAAVETTGGSRLLSGHVPMRDAPVVERLLGAGATIVGKTTADDLAVTGTGGTPATGVVRNPRDPDYLAGGSSAGSAAAVVSRDVDVALGTDTGGSVRIPASWSGCVGLKPTFDRVPFEGIHHLAPSLDHVGPMARTVEECARALTALTDDGTDFVVELGADPDALAVGLLAESFEFDDVTDDVRTTVMDSLETIASAGADVREVSVPLHERGPVTYGAVSAYEITQLVAADGMAHSRRRRYDESLVRAFGDARRARGGDLPFRLRALLILGEFLRREYAGVHYAAAATARDEFVDAYDDALEECDVLALPTTPTVARPVDAESTKEEQLLEHVSDPNTPQFNLTGHPAISIPCGSIDGLPVGLMLVGRRDDDETVLRAADAVESALPWEP